MSHLDFFNRQLELGDTVVTFDSTSQPLVYGKIIKLTPKNVRIEYEARSKYLDKLNTYQVLRRPNQVVKVPIDGQELMVYHLTK